MTLAEFTAQTNSVLADHGNDPDLLLASLGLIDSTIARIAWSPSARGGARDLRERIASAVAAIPSSADPLSGMDRLAAAGRLVAR